MFDFTEAKLLRLGKAAKQLGCELFVLDDGRFGKRDSDTSSLGDYSVNPKKLPNGLKGLGEKLNAIGLQFGLWFEPESVSPDSDLYRKHPDWALHDSLGREDLLGRHQLLLDLTKPDVRDYIVESVGKVLDSAPISYVKWDMNRHSCALGAKQHEFVLGLYDVLRRIFEPRPEILLESCSSGGNRFDCGMLFFSPQIWCSDNTDPVERLRIQQSLSYLYPPSCFGTHVSASPHAQTLRATPLSTRGNISMFGCLGYELDLTELLPVELTEIRAQIEFYKAHRRTLQYGRFTRDKTDSGGTIWQAQTEEETVAGVFHGIQSAAPGYERLRVAGLDAQTQYQLDSRPQLLRVGDFGSLLRHVLPVKLNPNGLAVQTADSYYKMYDGQQTVTASGAAYSAGIMLAPRFSGTGYNADGRMQGIQIRRDSAERMKYVWLSGAGRPCGTPARSWVHVTGNRAKATAVITEGPLKGDAASALSGDTLFLCVPGVSAIKYLPETLKNLHLTAVCEAFDMDKLRNPQVAAARKRLRQMIVDCGLPCRTLLWNETCNGIDDYLAAQKIC